jgi:hypothetical protein
MSAAALAAAIWPALHRQFEAALPQMDNTIRFQFRRWPRGRRADAIADARAAAWYAWHGLLTRGRDPMAVGPTGIAFNACRYVKLGRRLGTGSCGRRAADVYHRRAGQLGPRVISLDSEPGEGPGRDQDAWRAWPAADNRCTPADEAAFRLDFAAWLQALPPRKRRVAVLLAEGYTTGEVAALLGVTPGAVSQSRTWLAESWRQLQGEGPHSD